MRKRTSIFDKGLIGPTGEYPLGKMNKADKGELQLAVYISQTGKLVINFGTDVTFIGMTKEQAVGFAELILRKAAEME